MAPTRDLPSDEPAAPQFSLRSVLVVIAAVAVVCAIAAPGANLLTLFQFNMVVGFIAAYIVGAASWAVVVWVICTRRRRMRERNREARGDHLLAISTDPLLRPMTAYLLFIAILTGTGACWIGHKYLELARVPEVWDAATFITYFLFPLMAGFTLSVAICMSRMAAYGLELCENGVVIAHSKFVAWSALRGYTWSPNGRKVRLLLESEQHDLFVPRTRREAVDRILADRFQRVERNPGRETN